MSSLLFQSQSRTRPRVKELVTPPVQGFSPGTSHNIPDTAPKSYSVPLRGSSGSDYQSVCMHCVYVCVHVCMCVCVLSEPGQCLHLMNFHLQGCNAMIVPSPRIIPSPYHYNSSTWVTLYMHDIACESISVSSTCNYSYRMHQMLLLARAKVFKYRVNVHHTSMYLGPCAAP